MKNKVREETKINNWQVEERNSNICKDLIRDYCSHATLHGIGYLGSKNTSLPEKIWWLIIVLASLSFCVYLIAGSWIRWQNNPVVLNFEKEQRSISSIPFPSVTICPLNKIKQTYYNYTDYYHRRNSLTEQEYKKFWDISLVCDLKQYPEHYFTSDILNITDEIAMKNIRDVAPKLDDTVVYGIWRNKVVDNLFEEDLIREGLCFTFNALSQDNMFTNQRNSLQQKVNLNSRTSEWSMEDGYKSYLDMDAYPRRTAQTGTIHGLWFLLASNARDTDYICGIPFEGYKIILHNPVETTKSAQQFFLVGFEKRATIMIKPELVATRPELKSLDPHVRKCYFSHEKSLRFFEVYTYNNCFIECKANITEKHCGCVPFYLPRSVNSKICGFGKTDCLIDIEQKMFMFDLLKKGSDSSYQEMQTDEYKIFDNCDCIAACNDLQYSAEISYGDVHILETLKASDSMIVDFLNLKIQKQIKEGTCRISGVEIFFKKTEFLALTRSDLYAKTDFAANCGGLLGLFLGFSLLSVVEIIYFLTLRLWYRMRK